MSVAPLSSVVLVFCEVLIVSDGLSFMHDICNYLLIFLPKLVSYILCLECPQNRPLNIPKERQHQFIVGRPMFRYLANESRGMFPSEFPPSPRFVEVNPFLNALLDSVQDTGIFFVALKKTVHKIYAFLLMSGGKTHTNFAVPQVIIHSDLSRYIADAYDRRHLR